MRWNCMAVLLAALPAMAQVPRVAAVQPHTVAEQYLLLAVNAERAAAGLPALSWSEPLADAAAFHAAEMRTAREISHQFHGEPDLAERASGYGARFSVVAENVATSPSVLEMHTALMNSPHHRENILNPQATAVGISVVASGRQLWAVEDFARDVQELSLDEQEQRVSQLLKEIGMARALPSEAARETCGMPTGFVGTRPAFVMRYTASDLNKLPLQLTARLSQGGVAGAAVGACASTAGSFAAYTIAVVLYR